MSMIVHTNVITLPEKNLFPGLIIENKFEKNYLGIAELGEIMNIYFFEYL